MSEQYTHLLIAEGCFCPNPAQVARFFDDLSEAGVVPSSEFSLVRIDRVTPEIRRGRNPVTGEANEMRSPSWRPKRLAKLAAPSELETRAASLDEYDVAMSGEGRPRLAPLQFEFDGPYCLTVNCRIRSTPVSTSWFFGQSPSGKKPVRFGEDSAETLGLFADPHTEALIEVPGAGCARYWIEFELG